jgi:Arc/MetJ-type ribon-helix-helix transcriptional regulator
MTINLPREQQEWLEAQVKAGAYDSRSNAAKA